jgi:hypothetical protein
MKKKANNKPEWIVTTEEGDYIHTHNIVAGTVKQSSEFNTVIADGVVIKFGMRVASVEKATE